MTSSPRGKLTFEAILTSILTLFRSLRDSASFSKLFGNCFSSIVEDGHLSVDQGKDSTNSTQQTALSTIKDARQILKEYDGQSHGLSSIDSMPLCQSMEANWEQVTADTEELLAAGRDVASQRLDHFLSGDNVYSHSANSGKMEAATGIFTSDNELKLDNGDGKTWNTAVHEQESAVRRLLSAVPYSS